MLRHRNRHPGESQRSSRQRKRHRTHQPLRSKAGTEVRRSSRPDFLAPQELRHRDDVRPQFQRQDQQLPPHRAAVPRTRHYAQGDRTRQLLQAPRGDSQGRKRRIRFRVARRDERRSAQREPQRPAGRARGHHPQIRLQGRTFHYGPFAHYASGEQRHPVYGRHPRPESRPYLQRGPEAHLPRVHLRPFGPARRRKSPSQEHLPPHQGICRSKT